MVEDKNQEQLGFSLLEFVIALGLCSLFVVIGVPVTVRVIEWQRLHETTALLENRLRLAQSMSEINSDAASISLDRYDPYYQLRSGVNIVGYYGFSPGVNYKDGYLQLNSNRITYNQYGESEVSGVIRVTDGTDEQDITLYMGGLQAREGVLP